MSDNIVIRTRYFFMNRFLSDLISGDFVHFDAFWNWTDVYIWNNSIFNHLYNIFFHKLIIMWKSGNGQNFFITANSL